MGFRYGIKKKKKGKTISVLLVNTNSRRDIVCHLPLSTALSLTQVIKVCLSLQNLRTRGRGQT